MIVWLTVFIFLCVSTVFLYHKVRQNQQTKEAYHSIPSFQLPDLQGNIISNKSLQTNKSTLFLFFDPECGNCEEEFLQIKKHQDFLLDCQMVFISTLPEDLILNFLERIDFQPTANMFVLCDKEAKLLKTMNVKGVPSTLIYDKNGKLIKNYAGQVKVETLIKYLSD